MGNAKQLTICVSLGLLIAGCDQTTKSNEDLQRQSPEVDSAQGVRDVKIPAYAGKPPEHMLATEIEAQAGVGGIRALADAVTLIALMNARQWDAAKDHVGGAGKGSVEMIQKMAEAKKWPGIGSFSLYVFDAKTNTITLAFDYVEGPNPKEVLVLQYIITKKISGPMIYLIEPGPR